MDIIAFNIAGSEVHTITPTTVLPVITQKVNINGYTQPGSSANTAPSPLPINSVIKIEIDGKNVDGMTANLGEGSGIFFAGGSNGGELHGLSVYGFGGVSSGGGTSLKNSNVGGSADSLKFQGNFLSVKADGLTMLSDGHNDGGVDIFSGSQALIGGVNPEDRNIVGGVSSQVSGAAVAVLGNDTQAEVYGNYVGIGKDGETDLTPSQIQQNNFAPPYSLGISTAGDSPNSNNKIGGPSEAKTNVISGGNTALISFSSSGNTVQNNFIGTNWKGEVKSAITNGFGVAVALGSNNLIGGSGADEGNTIAGVSGSGVEISSFKSIPYSMDITPNNNAVLGNSIHSIGVLDLTGIGETNQGIDLAKVTDTNGDFSPDQYEERGPNPNDAGDTDDGPNGKINSPKINSAKQISNQIEINYDLDAADSPSNSYRVEFFANDASTIFGTGPGEEYLGTATVSPGTNKTASLTVSGDYSNKALSATTTAIDGTSSTGFGATSEFAKNVEIGSADDTDADGVIDSVEDGAPNNGDGNNDGVADKLQSTVSSFAGATGGNYITFSVAGCQENSNVAALDFGTLNTHDNGYEYPFGLTDFTLNCSRGDTANIAMYTFSEKGTDGFKARKFRSVTNSFATIDSATLTEEEIGGTKAIKLAYSITDGGSFDDDGQENGRIVDPVGLASPTLVATILPETGVPYWFLPVPLAILFTAAYVVYDWRRHRKPLITQDPNVHYTIWHHLRVVTIPVFKYRISFVVSKPAENSSHPLIR